jgi:hypothetical protein
LGAVVRLPHIDNNFIAKKYAPRRRDWPDGGVKFFQPLQRKIIPLARRENLPSCFFFSAAIRKSVFLLLNRVKSDRGTENK